MKAANTSDKRLRVLILAYACHPNRGSEPGVGWEWAQMMFDRYDVTVLTAAFNRPALEPRSLGRHVRFQYVPQRFWHYRPTRGWKFIERSPLKPIMNLAYSLWQRRAFAVASRLHAIEPFDLVHLVTYVGFRFPGPFYKLDVPLVWGPIGGLENAPWRFLPLMGGYGCGYYACRNLINSLQKRWLPGPKRAFAKAASTHSVIAATEGIRREIRRWYGCESEVICEIGPPPDVAGDFSRREPGEPLRIAWSGLHLPRKALPLLLRALAQLGPAQGKGHGSVNTERCAEQAPEPTTDHTDITDGEGSRRHPFPSSVNSVQSVVHPAVEPGLSQEGTTGETPVLLTVLGSGPCTRKWHAEAQRLGVDRQIEWTGGLPRDEAVARMHRAHLFVITSLQDLTSTVLLEALSQGVPVICPDHCGFGDVVTAECGIKVPVRSPRQLVGDLAAAIRQLADDEPSAAASRPGPCGGSRIFLGSGRRRRSTPFTTGP